jgi:hypothetical protein
MSFFFDKSNSIFIKSAQTSGEPYKAENDPGLQMAKNQGQQAESLSKYEEEKGEVKGLLRSYGLNDADIKFVESLKLPKDLLLEMTKKVIEAVNESGLTGQFRNWFKLATQSYFNSRNWTITEQILSSASQLQGKYINFPILASITSAINGETNPEIISMMNAAFGEEQKDANVFRSLIGLAQLSPKSTEEEAYFAYKQMQDSKNYQRDLTERAKGLTDMLQSAPYLAEEARMLQTIRTFYEGANASPAIRGWRGVLRALNMGQNIAAQGKSMISGVAPEEGKAVKSSTNKNIRIAAQNMAGIVQDFVKNWPKFYSTASASLSFVPKGNEIAQGLSIIDQSVKMLSTAKFDNTPEDQQNISQAMQNLAKSQEYIPQVQSSFQQQLQQNMQKSNIASNNNRQVLAEDWSGLGEGVGNVIGGGTEIGGLVLATASFVQGDFNRGLSILGSTLLAMLNTWREASGTAKVEGLTSDQLKNQQNAIKILNEASGESELMSKYYSLIMQFNNDQNNFKELIEITKSSVVSTGTGQANTNQSGVLGNPTQVYLTYQKIISRLQNIITIADVYLAKYKMTLEKMRQNPNAYLQAGQTEQEVENLLTILDYNYLKFSNLRMKAVAFYTDIYSISKYADKIQQENEILQKMKVIDTQARGISKILGPGALQQVMLGQNGIFDRVQKIKDLEIQAKNKITDDLRQKEKMLKTLSKVKQSGPQFARGTGEQV